MHTNPAQKSQPRSRDVKPVVVPSTQSASAGPMLNSQETASEIARKPRMNRGNRLQASAASEVWGAVPSRSTQPAQ